MAVVPRGCRIVKAEIVIPVCSGEAVFKPRYPRDYPMVEICRGVNFVFKTMNFLLMVITRGEPRDGMAQ